MPAIRTAAILTAVLCSAPAFGQGRDARSDEPALDRTPRSCIPASRIRSTEVIDDNTIIFRMRARDEAYVNSLPTRCPNLEREGRFTYQLRTGQICDDTTITVLELFGAGLGVTCRLGQFRPITVAEIDDLKRVRDGGAGSAIDIEEVEVPAEGSDGRAGSGEDGDAND